MNPSCGSCPLAQDTRPSSGNYTARRQLKAVTQFGGPRQVDNQSLSSGMCAVEVFCVCQDSFMCLVMYVLHWWNLV